VKRKGIILALILVAATWAVYWPVKNHEFVNFDDNEYISENWVVQKGLNKESVVWAFTTAFPTYWHPLTWLSITADVELFGLDPGRHHLSNVFLHTINALLLFSLLIRMSGAMWRSFFVALLFALHPLHVESVAWATARKDVLSTLFLFLTLLAYDGYTKKQTVKRYLLVLVPYGLGLMAKPMLVTLPLVLLLMDYWPLGRLHFQEPPPSKKKAKRSAAEGKNRSSALSLAYEKLPFLGLALICTLVVSFLRASGGEAFIDFETQPLALRIANALVSYVAYLGQAIWPMNLAPYYPFPVSLPAWQVAGAGVLLALISLGAIRSVSRRPYLLVGWLWYLVTLFPVIGLVQWGLWPARADRFTYVPLIGVFIMAVWGIPEIMGRWKYREVILAASGVAAVLYFSVFTSFQLSHWQNSITLFTRTLEVTDNNFLAHNNLGAALKVNGDVESAIRHYRESLRIDSSYAEANLNLGIELIIMGKLNEALMHLQRALQYRPDLGEAHEALGTLLSKLGRTEEAFTHLSRAIQLKPGFAQAHYALGVWFAEQGKTDQAIPHFQEAVRIKPGFAQAHYALGVWFAEQGKTDQAIAHFQEAVRVKPDYVTAIYNLGLAFAKQGNMERAVRSFSEAVRRKPDYAEAHFNLGVALNWQGKLEESVSCYQKALELKGDNADLHYHLGLALARQGKIEEARSHFSEATRLAPEFAEAHFNLGIANARQGKMDQAVANFSEALRIKPGFTEAQERLQALRSQMK
jgi:protein O-mannosyl-transferase